MTVSAVYAIQSYHFAFNSKGNIIWATRKSVLERSQTAQIRIILRMRKVSSGHLR